MIAGKLHPEKVISNRAYRQEELQLLDITKDAAPAIENGLCPEQITEALWRQLDFKHSGI